VESRILRKYIAWKVGRILKEVLMEVSPFLDWGLKLN
jgi:hypothetical protein